MSYTTRYQVYLGVPKYLYSTPNDWVLRYGKQDLQTFLDNMLPEFKVIEATIELNENDLTFSGEKK